jgi:hypothetical protein
MTVTPPDGPRHHAAMADEDARARNRGKSGRVAVLRQPRSLVDGRWWTDLDTVQAVTAQKSRQRSTGLVNGSVIAITFGTVFVFVNSGSLATPWPLVVRTIGLIVAVTLLVGVVSVARMAPSGPSVSATGFVDRRYWLVVALEAGALFVGLAVINNLLHRSAVSVAWVALVVGVHFFGLARIWRMPPFHWLGGAMTALGLAGFMVYMFGASAAVVGLVAGIGSGTALYAAVAIAVADPLLGRASGPRPTN